MSQEENKKEATSAPRKKTGPNKNRRRKSPNKGRNPNQGQGQKTSGVKKGPAPNRANTSAQGNQPDRKKRRRRRRPSENLNPLEKLFRKYDNLLEQHLIARKKYFELFHRADPRQKIKLEYNFTKTIKEVRELEESLHGSDRENFMAKYNGLNLDVTYTENRKMGIDGEKVPFEGDFEDPHYLPSQIESNFSEDTEESNGTFEDYMAYKGLN